LIILSPAQNEEENKYVVKFDPFRIDQVINETLTLTVNEGDYMSFEDYQLFMSDINANISDDVFMPFLKQIGEINMSSYFGIWPGEDWIN
jgi:hypothetical protein